MKILRKAVNARIKWPDTESTQEVEPRSPESERSWFTAQSGHGEASSSSLRVAELERRRQQRLRELEKAPPARRPWRRSWRGSEEEAATRNREVFIPPPPPIQSTAASSEGPEQEAATRKREVFIPPLPADLGYGMASQILRDRDSLEAQFLAGAWRVL